MFRTLRLWTKPTALRSYHSVSHPNILINKKAPESVLLTKALDYIPQHGFNKKCIDDAVRDLGYADSLQSVIAANPSNESPELQLTLFWLKFQRQKLYDHVLDPQSPFHAIPDEYDRAAYLLKERLSYNRPIVGQLASGLSQLVLPYNWSASLSELHALSDDIAYYAGDMSNDSAWYAKRLLLSSIYVKSELYMLSDTSPDFSSTSSFVDRNVSAVKFMGNSYNAVEQWSAFNAISLVNLIRSQLARG
ncbi:rpsU-divergently transcribed protein [Candidozyma auris]|nr:rpsU-divergently transcribed protein [[Candida] auris]QEL63327.1 rpsU-divergently transcribed protein [[Candida] auris]